MPAEEIGPFPVTQFFETPQPGLRVMLKKTGQRIIQQRWVISDYGAYVREEWRDLPLVVEE